MDKDIILLIFGGLFTALFWLLRNKDASQERQINLLFDKHDEDATALTNLRVQIAAKHYERPELDAKFDRLDQTFREGFAGLGAKFDKLSETLIAHISRDER